MPSINKVVCNFFNIYLRCWVAHLSNEVNQKYTRNILWSQAGKSSYLTFKYLKAKHGIINDFPYFEIDF